jgi:hypothetical protein
MVKVTRLSNTTPYVVTLSWENNSKQLDANSWHQFEDGGYELPQERGLFLFSIGNDEVQKASGSVYTVGEMLYLHYAEGTEQMYTRPEMISDLVVFHVGVLLSADNVRTGIVIGDWEVAPHK